MTDISELVQRIKAAAVRAKTATEEYASGHMSVSVCYAECEEFNRLTDGPDNILALTDSLETALHDKSEQSRIACELFDEITRQRLQLSESAAAQEKAQARIAELEADKESERREWMARGVESFVKYNQALADDYPTFMVAKALDVTEANAIRHCSRIRAGEVEL